MNNITIIGNLGQDPELQFIPSGKAKVKFSIADTRKVGEETETTWHRCIAWGQMAENIASLFSKGNRVIVTGRYKVDEYKTKTGEKKSQMEVLVDDCGQSIRFDLPSTDRPMFSKSNDSAPQSTLLDEEPF
jgi:single-strand DNA-binding protein